MRFSRIQKLVGAFCGTIFCLAGTSKLFVPFGAALAKMNVPFPYLAALGVSATEIGGGATLLFARFLPRRWRKTALRLACAALAIDMFAAIFLVGVPGKRGQTLNFDNHKIGEESWRLPLEVFLLLAMLWFAFQPPNEE